MRLTVSPANGCLQVLHVSFRASNRTRMGLSPDLLAASGPTFTISLADRQASHVVDTCQPARTQSLNEMEDEWGMGMLPVGSHPIDA